MRPLTVGQVVLFGALLTLALIGALFPFFPRQLPVHEGDVVSSDIRSPVDKTFESDVLTEKARDDAAQSVPVVLVFDPTIAMRQMASLGQATDNVTNVRQQQNLSESQKRAELLGIADLAGLSRQDIDTVLSLPDDRWEAVSSEAGRLLSGALTQSIAPAAVEQERSHLLQEASPSLSADEADVAAALAGGLLMPTLTEDQDATSQARNVARENVQPVLQTVSKGQRIVEANQPIDATTAEILREVGILTPRLRWQNLTAVAIVSAIAAGLIASYVWVFPVRGVASERNLILLTVLIAAPIFFAKIYFSLVLPDEERHFLAYFLPLAVGPMLIATLLEARLALMLAFMQALLLSFAIVYLPDISLVATIGPLDIARVLLVYGLGAVAGAFAAQHAVRPNQYVAGGLLVGIVAFSSLVAVWLLDPDRSGSDFFWMTTAAAVNGPVSGLLTAGAVAAVGLMLGVTTRLQLMELAQLNAPLLRRLQDEAPGTFHHSVIVGNLAERAADIVGADSLLVRVGCYYHDIGKVLQPGYYIENQMAGANPHDNMDPKASARIISQHVRAGIELAQKHSLPLGVQAFIPEHHGTRLIPYFYRIASEQDPKVAQEIFRYPGPRPQSRETAIVMLADSTEAMVRSSEDRSPERIDVMVEEVMSERLAEGELDDSDLTLRDLRKITESFKQTLRGVYHPRIAYPERTEVERRALIGRFRPGRRTPQPPPLPVPDTVHTTAGRSTRRAP